MMINIDIKFKKSLDTDADKVNSKGFIGDAKNLFINPYFYIFQKH